MSSASDSLIPINSDNSSTDNSRRHLFNFRESLRNSGIVCAVATFRGVKSSVFAGEIVISIASMFEMPTTREDHRDSVFVAGRNDFIVAAGTAGLDDGLDFGPSGFIDPVPERKECV